MAQVIYELSETGNITVEVADGGGGAAITINTEGRGKRAYKRFDNAMDGLAALLLAHASAGLDIASEAYRESVATAVESLANDYLE